MFKIKNARKAQSPAVGYFLCFILLTFSAVLTYVSPHGYDYIRSNLYNWPTTTGIVQSAKILTDKPEFHNEDTMYRLRVHIEYHVDGQSYHLYELYSGQANHWVNSYSTVRNELEDYSVGKKLEVRYSQENPGTSILKIPFSFASIVSSILALICLFYGLRFLCEAIYNTYRCINSYIKKFLKKS
ncbi:DUF3592 domain-containing protein [Aliikangiella sp. IMCC44359]|uniref:DUF3592 domain-containing protein n=1 Tax=Aliikangiella sp. IMCC44359 TaxID=3459125 RepID=UPI00403AFB75